VISIVSRSSIKEYYYQESKSSEKLFAKGDVILRGSVNDDYSLGKKLKGNALPNILQAHVDAGTLPEDESAVYFILTAADVEENIRNDLGGWASFCSCM
jgi:hypothetical protein